MLIDGTGDDYEKIKSKKEIIEKLGYDTYMLFVNTSLDVALERNANRSRSLPDDLVKEIWHSVQNNIGKFQNLFGIENIIIIDNSLSGIENIKKMEGAVSKLLRKPLQNYIGKQWIKANS
jgi:predicted kinase